MIYAIVQFVSRFHVEVQRPDYLLIMVATLE